MHRAFSIVSQYQESDENIWHDILPPDLAISIRSDQHRAVLLMCTKELEAHIKVFLEEVDEDLEMNNLLPLKNTSPLLVPAPVIPIFVPFAVNTG